MESFEKDIELINSIPIVPTLLEVVCRTTGMGFAAIARVTEERWVTCSVRDEILFGLQPGGELKVETTICHEIRQNNKEVVIDHVAADPFYATHHTPLMYGFQSYISYPIYRKDGSFFGTLCAIDPKPAKVNNPATIGMFKLFADLISFHINAIEELQLKDQVLLEERSNAELREQFIGILGHDLRNPLGAILMGSEILLDMPMDEEKKNIATLIKNSTYRMKGLIDNVFDFTQGRLGGGIKLAVSENKMLEKTLRHIIAEFQALSPSKRIESTIEIEKPVLCDNSRIAQLFSNILGNAITYGKEDSPVFINATADEKRFELSVINYGDPISPETQERLFQPFYRGAGKSVKKGLGLGLYISSEIARAHGGTLEVSSSIDQTKFTLTIPCS